MSCRINDFSYRAQGAAHRSVLAPASSPVSNGSKKVQQPGGKRMGIERMLAFCREMAVEFHFQCTMYARLYQRTDGIGFLFRIGFLDGSYAEMMRATLETYRSAAQP